MHPQLSTGHATVEQVEGPTLTSAPCETRSARGERACGMARRSCTSSGRWRRSSRKRRSGASARRRCSAASRARRSTSYIGRSMRWRSTSAAPAGGALPAMLSRKPFWHCRRAPLNGLQTRPACSHVRMASVEASVHGHAAERASDIPAEVWVILTWGQGHVQWPGCMAPLSPPLFAQPGAWVAWRSASPGRISSARPSKHGQHRHAGHAGRASPQVRD